MTKKHKGLHTQAVHGAGCEQYPHFSGTPPIYLTSTFAFPSLEEGAKIARGTGEGYMYTRHSNPTIDVWVERMAALEGAAGGCATASGMAAISSAVMHFTHAGDNYISSRMVYSGTLRFFKDVLPKYGLETRFVDMHDMGALEAAMDERTRAVFLESPDNPLLRIYDLEAVVKLAHARSIPVIVDSTFMSPALFRPFEWGADVVVHSATKYLCGNGSLIAGIVLTKDAELAHHIQHDTVYNFGGVMSPVNAWLMTMNLQTLPLRMARHSENALKVARFLEADKRVAWIHYPGLASHPEARLAAKYFPQGGSGMIAFGLKGGAEACRKAVESTETIIHQVSLGDAKSLMIHPYSVMFETMSGEERAKLGVTPEMLRLSVGLEDADDLIADLDQALG